MARPIGRRDRACVMRLQSRKPSRRLIPATCVFRRSPRGMTQSARAPSQSAATPHPVSRKRLSHHPLSLGRIHTQLPVTVGRELVLARAMARRWCLIHLGPRNFELQPMKRGGVRLVRRSWSSRCPCAVRARLPAAPSIRVTEATSPAQRVRGEPGKRRHPRRSLRQSQVPTIEGRLRHQRTLLTREGDRDGAARSAAAAIANNNKADLFISLHANASVRNSVRGRATQCSSEYW